MILSPALNRACLAAEASLPQLYQPSKEIESVEARRIFFAWLYLVEGRSSCWGSAKLHRHHTTAIHAIQRWATDRMGLEPKTSLAQIGVAFATWSYGLQSLAFAVEIENEAPTEHEKDEAA